MFIECSDGVQLAYTLTVPSKTATSTTAVKATPRFVVINSATGVRRSFTAHSPSTCPTQGAMC